VLQVHCSTLLQQRAPYVAAVLSTGCLQRGQKACICLVCAERSCGGLLALVCRRYVADVVAELRHPRVVREGCQSRLLFKKRMFR
jgi:hypothetical protein